MAKYVACSKGCTVYTRPKVEKVNRNGKCITYVPVVAAKKKKAR
jgi:hypothetical protein